MTTDERTTVLSKKDILLKQVDDLVKNHAEYTKNQNEAKMYNSEICSKAIGKSLAIGLPMAVIASVISIILGLSIELSVLSCALLLIITFFISHTIIYTIKSKKCDDEYSAFDKDRQFKTTLHDLQVQIFENETGMKVLKKSYKHKGEFLLGNKDGEAVKYFIKWDNEKEFTYFKMTDIEKNDK